MRGRQEGRRRRERVSVVESKRARGREGGRERTEERGVEPEREKWYMREHLREHLHVRELDSEHVRLHWDGSVLAGDALHKYGRLIPDPAAEGSR